MDGDDRDCDATADGAIRDEGGPWEKDALRRMPAEAVVRDDAAVGNAITERRLRSATTGAVVADKDDANDAAG